jgi:predicted nucleic acid-binding protein
LDYLVSTRLHAGVLIAVLDDIVAGSYAVMDLEAEDYPRVRELCDRYSDSDIGFVDAAVLSLAERLQEPKIATLDQRHFSMMRPRHVDALTLLPA